MQWCHAPSNPSTIGTPQVTRPLVAVIMAALDIVWYWSTIYILTRTIHSKIRYA